MQNPNLGGRQFQGGMIKNEVGSNNNQQQNNTTAFDEPIKLEQPKKFPSSVDCAILSTYDIAEDISELLSGIFKDFAGVHITPVTAGGTGFVITLYFCDPRVDNGGEYRAFNTINSQQPQKQNSVMANLRATEVRMNSTIFSISEEGKKALSQFVFPQWKRNGVVDWNSIKMNGGIGEKQHPEMGVLALVTGVFDINAFLSVIYGNKSKTGEVYQYNVTPLKPQSAVQPGMSGYSSVDWVAIVNRFEMKALNKAGRKCGFIGYNSGIQMVGRR